MHKSVVQLVVHSYNVAHIDTGYWLDFNADCQQVKDQMTTVCVACQSNRFNVLSNTHYLISGARELRQSTQT